MKKFETLSLFKKFFILSTLFCTISVNGMFKFTYDKFKETTNYLFPTKPELVGSPAEQKFIMQIKQWTASNRNFEVFKRTMEQYVSSSASPLIKQAFNISINSLNHSDNFKGHADTITTVALSPDGKYAATGSYDRKIKIWDLSKWKNSLNISTSKKDADLEEITTFDFSNNPETIGTFQDNDRTNILQWHPSEPYILVGSGDRTNNNSFRILDVSDPKNPKEIFKQITRYPVISVDWNNAGDKAAINYIGYSSAEIWDFSTINTPTLIKNLPNASSNTIQWINENQIIRAGDIYNISSGSVKSIYDTSYEPSHIMASKASPNGKYLFVAGLGEDIKTHPAVQIWDLQQFKPIANFLDKPKSIIQYDIYKQFHTTNNAVAWSSDSNFVLAMDSNISKSEKGNPNFYKAVVLWDLRDKNNLQNNPLAILGGHQNEINAIAWSKDMRTVIVGDMFGGLKVWDFSDVFNLDKEFTKLLRTSEGAIAVLLFKSILENREKQNKLNIQKPLPFIITYPKLKTVFKKLPKSLQNGLIEKGYVEFKELKKK